MDLVKIIKVIFVVTFCLTPVLTLGQIQPKEAERLYVVSSMTKVAPESEIIVRVLINNTRPINALDLKLTYPKSLLKPILFNDGTSIVDIWQTRQWEQGDGIIILVGGILRSFSGTGGTIAEFRFKAKNEGVAQISFDDANVYYADGIGTSAKIITEPINIIINANALQSYPQQEKDTVPPVFEVTKTVNNPTNVNYLAVFDVKDTGSGIKAVYIRSMKWIAFDEWRVVSNPAQLPLGIWQYQISATDNNGNTSIKTLYIPMEITKKLFLVILLFFIVAIFYIIIREWILLKKPL